ncbi:BglG family transcription antiterminator [Lihuaxuella thermophila]|uniref:Mannitol operon transcriptional antiterminator n=1 Tax=Lihuaxuella thermophila TaxID=1173111 RepID=A0A1H8ICG3_9BACL|nr:BglG family transcription antiterminator [Lihuaxuella thermophila]SEN65867.1 mannitol operon transcriptional antiterminator [Lihuaxuella thermophila]
MNISSRQRQILEILLRERDGITVREIAEEVQISSRTVHRELNDVEKLLNRYELKLKKKAGTGLLIQGDQEKLEELKQALLRMIPNEYTPDERKTFILCTLLEATEPVKLIGLAYDLKVTPATISHDLDEISDWAAQFNLQIIRRRGYGVEITGTEESKRKAISALIAENVDESEFIRLLKDNIQHKPVQALDTASQRLFHLIPKERLVAVEHALADLSGLLPYPLADSAYIGLVVHLSLVIERIAKGEQIEIDPVYLHELEGTPEFQAAKQIVERLESYFRLPFPVDEIGYVTMHLRGAKLRGSQFLEDPRAELTASAKKLIRICEEKLGADLSDDRSLLQGLITHLEPAVHRLKRNLKIRNPLLKKIKADYSELFQVVQEAVSEVFPRLRVPDEEIGYLVMHIGSSLEKTDRGRKHFRVLIVCSSGIGSSKMLAARLKSAVPEIRVLRNASVFEINDIDDKEYDLIVSTIPIPSKNPEDYIVVSPMLTEKEIEKIRSVLRKNQPSSTVKTGQPPEASSLGQLESLHASLGYAVDLMKNFHLVTIENQDMNLPEILFQACETLVNQGIVKQSEPVVHQLLEREKQGGLGIPEAKAGLFHCRSEQVTKPSFTMYALRDPLPIRSMDEGTVEIDKILLMLTPVSIPREAAEILSEISALFIEPETARILASDDPSDIRQYFIQHLYRFCSEKINHRERL